MYDVIHDVKLRHWQSK